MTYRIGPHSTSDDDSNYRVHDAPVEGFATERDYWEARSPIIRFGKHLHLTPTLSLTLTLTLILTLTLTMVQVLESVCGTEAQPKPPPELIEER